jgi:hypothetical protein
LAIGSLIGASLAPKAACVTVADIHCGRESGEILHPDAGIVKAREGYTLSGLIRRAMTNRANTEA